MSGGPPGSGSDNRHRDGAGEREGEEEEEEEVERRDESRVIKTHFEAMTFDTSTGRSLYSIPGNLELLYVMSCDVM